MEGKPPLANELLGNFSQVLLLQGSFHGQGTHFSSTIHLTFHKTYFTSVNICGNLPVLCDLYTMTEKLWKAADVLGHIL